VTDGYAENYSNYESTSTTGYGIEGAETFLGSFDANGYNSNSFEQQSSSVTTNYATDAHGLYNDPNPHIIRRPALGDAKVYTQRVLLKFLQPPPIPPPGVSNSNKHYLSFIERKIQLILASDY
jgi:hypothetical protein